jgi:hypothetical protein
MSTPWFDEIGFTYAKNHDEVEAARSGFILQRERVVARLEEVCLEALSDARASFDLGATEGGWQTVWVNAKHARARRDIVGKTKCQSGICFGFDYDRCFLSSEGGRFGFGTYALFAMGDKSFAHVRPALVKLENPVDYDDTDQLIYVRGAWTLPAQELFTLEALERKVAMLPALFAKVDEVVANAYIKKKVG